MNILGASLSGQGKLEEAVAACRQALQLNPRNAEPHNNLGILLEKLGRSDEAVESYREALKHRPDYAEAHANLGIALKRQGALEEAVASYRTSLKLKPANALAHNNLGIALKDLDRLEEAVDCFEQALAIKPGFAEAHNSLGNALQNLDRLEDAIASYEQALKIKPSYVEALNNLGTVLRDVGRLEEAANRFRMAVEISSSFAEAHSNLGSVLENLSKPNEAVECYNRALEIDPGSAATHSKLGSLLFQMSSPAEGAECFRKAYELTPQNTLYAINAALMLPAIPESNQHIQHWRIQHERGRNEIASLACEDNDPGSKINAPSFLLSYNNEHNLVHMQELSAAFRKMMPVLDYTAPHIETWQNKSGIPEKIRVGILSEYFKTHTIAKLYGPLIESLDRDRFEVQVFHGSNTKFDEVSDRIDQSADEAFRLDGDIVAQRETISTQALDVLFYPDIGMSPSTYFLAYSRLAPVQAVSFGHPETTGLDTIDYFVSATQMESDTAEQHYCETLICLNRLPCFFHPPSNLPAITSRSALGLPESGTLYGCPQTLIKLHPDFDEILAEILERDPEGYIILIRSNFDSWRNRLLERWEKKYPALSERVLFLRPMRQERFFQFLDQMDVLLDPIYFGSGTSFFESMTIGIPTVTWPGDYMRGRIASGAYRQMGIAEPLIVQDRDDYAKVAVELAHDTEQLKVLRRDLKQRAQTELFEVGKAVGEFEAFLVAAVETAKSKRKLPSRWSPTQT